MVSVEHEIRSLDQRQTGSAQGTFAVVRRVILDRINGGHHAVGGEAARLLKEFAAGFGPACQGKRLSPWPILAMAHDSAGGFVEAKDSCSQSQRPANCRNK